MALIKCKECGEQVSTTAQSCPKCGAKPPKQTSVVTWFVLAFIVFVAYAAIRTPSTNTSSSSASSTATSERSPAPIQKPQWETSTSVDKMSGKRQVFASSPTVPPTEKMEFPYSDVAAWLGVGCDGKSEWAYVGFTKAPNLTDTETESGYSRINTRIKWGESLQNVELTQEWGASFLHFQADRQAISKMSTSNSALLELKWYGQNHPYFSFPLDGAANAIAEMRKQCAGKK